MQHSVYNGRLERKRESWRGMESWLIVKVKVLEKMNYRKMIIWWIVARNSCVCLYHFLIQFSVASGAYWLRYLTRPFLRYL